MTDFTWKHFAYGVFATVVLMAIILGGAYLTRHPKVKCISGYKYLVFNKELSQVIDSSGGGVRCSPEDY